MKLIYLITLLMYLPNLLNGCANLTDWANHRRSKRFLIFQNQGVIRLGFGVSAPVELRDRVAYRQLRIVYYILASYDLPTTAAMLRHSWGGRKLETMKYAYDNIKLNENDHFRTILYTMIEVKLNQNGRNGRECLKRAICENGLYADNDGLMSEIVHEILRPSNHNSDKEYLDAYSVGKYGCDCISAFPDCAKGDSFLDNLIFLKEY